MPWESKGSHTCIQVIKPTLVELREVLKENFSFAFLFLPFFFLMAVPWHMEVPGLGVDSELHLPAYATTATLDPSHICDLHFSLLQCWILTPLSEARDQTCILSETTSGSYTSYS